MRPVIAALAASFVLAGTAHAQVGSTFATGTEGWVSGSFDTGTATSTNTVTYDSATQSIVATDPDTDYDGFLAPAKFLGNLSGYAGGTVSFQLADSQGNEQYEAPLVLFGNGLKLFAYLPFAPSTDPNSLSSYSISLVGASFGTGSAGAPGAPATDAQLATVLANVTLFGIGLDFHAGPDTVRLDNVVLAQPAAAALPEPASWALMIVGLGAAGVALRRRTGAVRYARAGEGAARA